MTWAKIDDQFYLGLKNAAIDRDEQDLYVASLVYCNGQLTDGFIPNSILMQLYLWAKIPLEANAEAKAQAIASRLVEHEFWHVVDGGYQVHDFLDWNPSRADVMALREARSEAGKRGGEHSAAARQAKASKTASNCSSKTEAKFNPVPVPVPVPLSNQEEDLTLDIDDDLTPEQRAIRNAYDACGITFSKTHEDAHLLTIKQVGLSTWQRGWALAMEKGKHNLPAYVARCAESAMLAEQRGNNGNGKMGLAPVPATLEGRKSMYGYDSHEGEDT